MGAIPYFLTKPAVDLVVAKTLAARGRADTTAQYNDPRWRRVEFYKKVRRLGLDVRFGLVGAITQALCMAPLSAYSAVVIFGLLGHLGLGRRVALALAFLYAFGTPVFFRTAFLNQNLGIGVASLLAFVLIWNPGGHLGWSLRTRYLLAGFLGGFCLLTDYSGGLSLGLLGLYALWVGRDEYGFGRGPGLLVVCRRRHPAGSDAVLCNGHPSATGSTRRNTGCHRCKGPMWATGVAASLQSWFGFSSSNRYGLFIVIHYLLLRSIWLSRRDFILAVAQAWFCWPIRWPSSSSSDASSTPAAIRDGASRTRRSFRSSSAGAVVLPTRWLGYSSLGLIRHQWSISMVRSGGVMDNRSMSSWPADSWLCSGKNFRQYLPWLEAPVNALLLRAVGYLSPSCGPFETQPASGRESQGREVVSTAEVDECCGHS
jgi:hypothetical protein